MKLRNRLRQFDIRETPFMNKYGNTNSFIIIFGSAHGHFGGREIRGKPSSVTTHRIPRNVNAMLYEFAIIQCPIYTAAQRGHVKKIIYLVPTT